jgi:transposase
MRTAAFRRSVRARLWCQPLAWELSDALKQIRELERMLGKKTMEAEILKEALEIAPSRNELPFTLVAGGDQ